MDKYLDVFKQTVKKYSEDKVPRLGAALAYYTIFSVGPLLLIAVAPRQRIERTSQCPALPRRGSSEGRACDQQGPDRGDQSGDPAGSDLDDSSWSSAPEPAQRSLATLAGGAQETPARDDTRMPS